MKEIGAESPQARRLAVDPTLVAHGAGRMLDVSQASGDLIRSLLSNLDFGPDACPSLYGGGRFAQAHRDSLAAVSATLERLTQVLEGDADRLYRVAFALRETDRAAAGRFGP